MVTQIAESPKINVQKSIIESYFSKDDLKIEYNKDSIMRGKELKEIF